MEKENAERTGVRVTREYPTEWCWYPADREIDDQQRLRDEDRRRQDDTLRRTISPPAFDGQRNSAV